MSNPSPETYLPPIKGKNEIGRHQPTSEQVSDGLDRALNGDIKGRDGSAKGGKGTELGAVKDTQGGGKGLNVSRASQLQLWFLDSATPRFLAFLPWACSSLASFICCRSRLFWPLYRQFNEQN